MTEQEMRALRIGDRVRIDGADDVDTIRAVTTDGIVVGDPGIDEWPMYWSDAPIIHHVRA